MPIDPFRSQRDSATLFGPKPDAIRSFDLPGPLSRVPSHMNLRSYFPATTVPLSSALALVGLAGTAAAAPQAGGQAGMLRYPDVSDTSIVFVYANDLWLVPREGGTALPLASPPGAERNPRFSVDGTQVAFSGNYEGDSDLYTLSTKGGVPFRVTHHPGGDMSATGPRTVDWSSPRRRSQASAEPRACSPSLAPAASRRSSLSPTD